MSTAGLSKARLERMREVLAGHVRSGDVPGIVTLVSRRDEVHVETLGTTTAGGDVPIQRDTIFRISSMTKPVAAVAALILVEQCRLRLDDPVDDLLPELADRMVLTSLDAPLTDTVPAHRPITPRDLLTFQFGFGQLFVPPDRYPITQAAAEAELGMGPPNPAGLPAPDEWLRRLGELPLMYQPGERWLYNTGADVLGVLIARASGQPLETFLREQLFAPLGMADTGFSVPADQLHRLATSYAVDPGSAALTVFDEAEGGQWTTPPAFPSAAGGLVSTADDYLAFGRMLLNNGRHDGERILSRTTVRAMTTDQLSPAVKAVSGFLPGYFDSRGWGLGVGVTTARTSPSAVPGQFGWDGGLGTSWFTDPAEELVAILMTQRSGFPLLSPVYQDFWTSVYQSIDD
ncbi:MAG TPA: serine hydrolase domain-containing protein [Pseudonocardiaceae bacterium]|jgi:CubicO group peptidase (beta-lactamase class C family)|nr:serine hydrolase domain-containing protein [Pseudonocardiaceae bacterium]